MRLHPSFSSESGAKLEHASVAEHCRAGRGRERMVPLRWLLVCSIILLSCPGKQGLQRLVGGLLPASINDEGARQALQFAMNEYNRASNDMYASRVSEVVQVQKQIVSGVKYFLDVKVGRTTCTKGVADVENCAFHEAPELAKTLTCRFVVYTIPWRNHISLKENRCT